MSSVQRVPSQAMSRQTSSDDNSRLPRGISRCVGRPKLSRRQVGRTLVGIDDIIRARMLRGEPVPLAMRQYAIGGGRIVFSVAGEFGVTLTLLQHGGSDIPWHVVGVSLVAGQPADPSQERWLAERAQQILVAAAQAQAQAEAGAPQLAQLYDFLHGQSLRALVVAVARQAAALRRTRWEGSLLADAAGDGSAVALRYWASGRAALAAGGGGGGNSVELRIVAMPVPRPLHTGAEFAAVERARRDLIPKEGLRITWTASAGLAAPTTWTRTAGALLALGDGSGRLALDAAQVDVDALLRQATAQHADAMLAALCGQAARFGEAAVDARRPVLRAWVRSGAGAVEVSADCVSGRLRAHSAAFARQIAAYGLAERLNRSPWRVAELLWDLRAALALADLDALADRALGLARIGGPAAAAAASFPLRVAPADAAMLARDVGGDWARLRFYGVGGTGGAWFVMAAMTDRLRFRLVRLAPGLLVRAVAHVEALQVDRLFASVSRSIGIGADAASEMLDGRRGIAIDYVNALASAVRARVAVRSLQAQLAARGIAYAFRLPKFSSSPHGPRGAVSQELSIVDISHVGLYDLDEHVPVLYVPAAALMHAAPVNWRVARCAVPPDAARRMVSLRVAADEATATAEPACHVVAQLPVALDALPAPVAQAYGRSSYAKDVRVYRRVADAVQRLIRDWAELHLMAHVARQLFAWEQRALRRVLAATVAYYASSAGPYTQTAIGSIKSDSSVSKEIVVQCLGSCFLSISCCVPPDDAVTYHLTLADVDSKTGHTARLASTWPSALQNPRNDAGLARWLRTLQARLNSSGNPLAVLSIVVQMMPISHMLRSIAHDPPNNVMASVEAPCPSLVQPVDDVARAAFHRIASFMTSDVARAFEDVRKLHVMHMYTAADNMRLVFNSRYVVDLRLVSSDLFHITDAVGARSLSNNSGGGGGGGAPEPLVMPATEPIPLFADWLDAMARGMRFDWERLEKCVSSILGHNDYSTDTGSDGGNRVRVFQRNMHRLRPGASKVELYLRHFQELTNKKNSLRAPTFVALPPAAVLCTRLHLVAVLKSLIHWLEQSVHVRDLLESAIARTQQDILLQKHGLFCVKEKMVYTEQVGGRQVVIVGFTGARDSVRCEFLIQASVGRGEGEGEVKEEEEQPTAVAATEDDNMELMISDLYS
ncbi:mediator complex subunit, partial [Coemansia aciculifera]